VSKDRHYMFETPVGWVALLGSNKGLRRLSLKPTPEEAMDDLGGLSEEATLDQDWFLPVQKGVERYLEGDPRALDDIELDLEQTPGFFRAAWDACREIPAGETRSYAWLAAQAGSPLAVRAAGQAMARNRWPLIVPCHRVIGSNGGLHGYGGGGLKVKAQLLEMERVAAEGPVKS
jgi:methylated-DNA-[protein]-cysteine S-methyltransferase